MPPPPNIVIVAEDPYEQQRAKQQPAIDSMVQSSTAETAELDTAETSGVETPETTGETIQATEQATENPWQAVQDYQDSIPEGDHEWQENDQKQKAFMEMEDAESRSPKVEDRPPPDNEEETEDEEEEGIDR